MARYELYTRMRDTIKPRVDSVVLDGRGGEPYWKTTYMESELPTALTDFLVATKTESYACLVYTEYVSGTQGP